MTRNAGLMALCMAATLTACAFQPPPPPPPPFDAGRRGPPPEFVDACANRVEGTAVQITGRRGEALSGFCVRGPEGVLALRPDRRPQPSP